jgi:hypothetical protein
MESKMKRIIAASLIALAAAGVASAPAMAQDSLTCDTELFGEYDAAAVLARLKDKGIDATSVGEWGNNTIIATVRVEGGHTVFHYYDVATLKELAIPTGAPAGTRAPQISPESTGSIAPTTPACPPSLVSPESDDEDN